MSMCMITRSRAVGSVGNAGVAGSQDDQDRRGVAGWGGRAGGAACGCAVIVRNFQDWSATACAR